ncbi:MAG: hypothetical protein LBQ46_02630, partial [Treponema sp.]|jgi:hypothetical protein|nr:hypothetical protein [Treponema sp.]
VIPAPNLNVIHPSAVIPVLEGRVGAGITLLGCAVWAGDASVGIPGGSPPLLRGKDRGDSNRSDYYRFEITDATENKTLELSFC